MYEPLENVVAVVTKDDEKVDLGSSEGGEKQEDAKKQVKAILASMKTKSGSKVQKYDNNNITFMLMHLLVEPK